MPEHPAGPSAPTATSAGTRLGVLAVAVMVGLLAAPIATHTWQSTAVTGAIGLVAVAAAISGRPFRVGANGGAGAAAGGPDARRTATPPPANGDAGRAPRRLGWTAAPWFVLFAVATVLELGALAWGDRPSFPTVSWLLGPYFVEPAVRFAGYVVWICAGWWLVRR